jgi:hypothetical protein
MRVFSVGLQLSVYPWAEARPLKEPRSRWTRIPQYPEHRQRSHDTTSRIAPQHINIKPLNITQHSFTTNISTSPCPQELNELLTRHHMDHEKR